MSKHIVLTGGGTAGHIEPMLATAAALQRIDPSIGITCVGTVGRLETTLVPERGFPLEVVAAVPLPRKPSKDLVALPFRLLKARAQAKKILRRVDAAAVVGFGGYAALPSYLAAHSLDIPIVIHEANATAGIANKVGARWAAVIAQATPAAQLPGGEVIGMPIRESIAALDRAALRAEALEHFGLQAATKTLLVYGGSQGAQRINDAIVQAAPAVHEAGVQVVHSYGNKNEIDAPQFTEGAPYTALPYIDRMDLAYAAADFVLCRSGMGTVAEVSAVGLPAMYVPLPHGNGEQRRNAEPIVQAGGGLLVDDAQLTAERIVSDLLPILSDDKALQAMGDAARAGGHAEAADRLARRVLEVAR